MKFRHLVATSLLASACVGLAGCADNISPNTYSGSDVGTVSTVKKGVIVSMRNVNIDNNSGAGGLVGAAGGAAAGSMIGTNTASTLLGALGGAVVGGLAGNAIDKGVNHHQGYEYIIKLADSKDTIAVTQNSDGPLQVHQHVLVIYGKMTRVVPDNG